MALWQFKLHFTGKKNEIHKSDLFDQLYIVSEWEWLLEIRFPNIHFLLLSLGLHMQSCGNHLHLCQNSLTDLAPARHTEPTRYHISLFAHWASEPFLFFLCLLDTTEFQMAGKPHCSSVSSLGFQLKCLPWPSLFKQHPYRETFSNTFLCLPFSYNSKLPKDIYNLLCPFLSVSLADVIGKL